MTDTFRVSPQQRRIWGLLTDATPSAFQLVRAVHVVGSLERSRLEAAIARVIDRHEVLRTSFQVLPGTSIPVQRIHARAGASIDYRPLPPLSSTSDGAAPLAVRRLIDEPLDVQQGPTVRFVVFEESAERHVLAVAASALSADLEGLDKVLQAVTTEYRSAVRPDESDGPAQYADLAEWQHTLLTDDGAAEGVAFWNRSGFLELSPPDVPFCRSKPRGEPFTPRTVEWTLGPEVLASARAVVDRSNVSLAALALAAWETVLWRFSGQESFVIGVGCHGRTYAELQDALGLFARDLPKVCTVDGAMTFADAAQRATAALAELFDRQEYFSWDHVDDRAGRWRGHYFPVSFRFEERTWRDDAAGATCRPVYSFGSGERFVLRADVTVTEASVSLQLHFDEARIRRHDVERIGDTFATVIAGGVTAPESVLTALDLLREDGRRKLLDELAFVQTPTRAARRIHELFDEWVAKTPEQPAVIAGERPVTYGELGERVRALASRLRAVGVGPETPVGLLVRRSVDMVAGIFGILEAGGAYVPVDPSYPEDRVRFMLNDAGARVLLTTRELAAQYSAPTAQMIYLDEEAEPAGPTPDDRTPADTLAYIIYTSGSTGTPKGVEVTHANLVHSTTVRDLVYDRPPERFLLLSSFSFDSSVAGIFWTLCRGGALVLPEEGLERDVNALAEMIERHQVTHTLCLPSLYQLLLDHAAEQIGSLNTVIVAGEACRSELVAAHGQILPETSLFNEYGPTEATVWSTVHDCSRAAADPVPIGRPLPNTQAYVLDEQRRLVPIGVPGELYVGGPGVARGYRNRPDLTAQRFVPDVIGGAAGARLYRTGDRARYLSDGTIEFLGRVDQQVKIRGYRIELEEIEARLAAFPGVREVAVIAREDVTGDKRLVGYIAPVTSVPSVDSLVTALRTQLPDYMIPSVILRLDDLPKTATGKIDRGALPAPERFSASHHDVVAPRTTVEEVLAGLWADVFGLDVVGVHDDFFKLGGHSLLVTRLVARVRETFRVDIPLRSVFEKPTVAQFSEYLLSRSDSPDELERTADLLVQVARMSDEGVEAALGRNADATERS